MSLIDTLDPVLQPWAWKLFQLAERAGVHPRITSGRRSYATQEQLYKAFLGGKSKYPAAPPGSSAHEYGLAFDMAVEGTVNQGDCGVVWVAWGGRYGGEEDPVHFEHPAFKTTIAAGPRSGSPPPTEGSISDTVQAVANALVLQVPSPLRGIWSIAEVAAWVAAEAGSPYGASVQWMLRHPAQVTEAFVAAGWRALLGR